MPEIVSASHCRFRRGARALSAATVFFCLPLAGFQPRPTPPPLARHENEGLVPPNDRDAESWLRRARQAADEQDWKLAADTLARVTEEYWDKTVTTEDGQRYVSVLRAAQNQIGQWPAEGLAAYRLLYDPEVVQRLKKAEETRDLRELRLIVRRFPYSTPGPRAINLLAGWLIDGHEAGEAISLLNRLLELRQTQVPLWQIYQKLIVAYVLDWRPTAASDVLARLRALASSDAAALPTDFSDRLETLQRYIETARLDAEAEAVDPSKAWPVLMGPAGAGGRMAAIDPAVTPGTVLRDVLPGARAIDQEWVARLIKQTGRPPVWQVVTDGKALFATCPDGLIARDLSTFDLLWLVTPRVPPRDPQIDRQRRMAGFIEVDNTDRLDEASTRSLWHEYRGAVSTAFGLVFFIEQAETANEQFPTRHGAAATNAIFTADYYAQPNSLRAFEASTGRALWTKGRGGPAPDELRLAHFYSPPVASGSHLIAPYQEGPDLLLLALRTDGEIDRRVLLGTAPPGMLPMNGVLQPTVEDGMIYLCTGAGMLMALDAADYSLVWLAPYQRSELVVPASDIRRQWNLGGAASPAIRQPDFWVHSPPLVAGGSVIVAPPDSDFVLAFDRQTGEKKWAYPRGAHRYLVGTTQRMLLIAGRTVAALDAESGQARWVFDRATVTGRPALCGDQVFVPSTDGLYRLDVRNGREIGEKLLSDAPLGNLFALDGALYSVSADSLSKFPDFEQSRRIATDLLAKRPDDTNAHLRLAWLAALKKDWSEALTHLDDAEKVLSVPTSAPGGGTAGENSRSELRDRIGHQRIDYLLRLAEGTDLADRRALLERALASGRRPEDALRAGLALCEWLRESGELEEACGRLFTLLLTAPAGALALEGELTVSPVALIRERMQAVWQSLSASQREKVREQLGRSIREVASATSLEQAIRVSDGMSISPGGDASICPPGELAGLNLCIGKQLLGTGHHDSACFFLERCARTDPSGPESFEARVRLAMEYAWPGQGLPTLAGEAARVLAELADVDGARALPADLPAMRFLPKPNTLAELREQLAQLLPPDALNPAALPDVLRGMPRLQLAGEQALPPNLSAPDVRSFHDPYRAFDPFGDVLPLRFMRQIKGCSTNSPTGAPAWWAAELNWSVEQDPGLGARLDFLPHRAAALSGSVAALDADSQIATLGLLSGQLLWPPIILDRAHGLLPDPPVVAVGGTIIVAPDCVTLLAAPARETEQPMWKRQFFGRPLGMLRVVGDRLVAIDRGQTRLFVLDPKSGRVRRQFDLAESGHAAEVVPESKAEETSPDEARAPIVASLTAMVGATVCRADGKSIVARDIGTGRRLWERSVAKPIQSLLPLNDEYLLACHGEETLEILRGDDGKPVRVLRRPGYLFPPLDATIETARGAGGSARGRFLLYARTRFDPPHYALESFPLEEGEGSWRRDLGEFATISPRMLRTSPDFLPFVTYTRTPQEEHRFNQFTPIQRAELQILDKSTNEPLLAEPFSFAGTGVADGQFRSRVICDVIVQNRRILAVAPEGYYVLTRSSAVRPVAATTENR